MAARKRTRRAAARKPAKRGAASRNTSSREQRNAESRERTHDGTPHAFWSGTITFGLVSVPVDLYPAVRSRRAPLRMLGPSNQLLQRRYYCESDDKALTNDEIVRGYEWPDGSFTVVSAEELDSLAPRKSREIDLQRFVSRDEIPPKLLERPYVLAPAGESTKAYHLLAKTMEQTGRAGIATFVMRGREYLAAIFAERGLLRAATMRFVDELRTPESIGLPEVPKLAAGERKHAAAALAELKTDDLDRAALEDDYTKAVLELAEKKRAARRDVVEVDDDGAADERDTAEIIDIMNVLKQRLSGARGPAAAESTGRARRGEVAAREPAKPSAGGRRKKTS